MSISCLFIIMDNNKKSAKEKVKSSINKLHPTCQEVDQFSVFIQVQATQSIKEYLHKFGQNIVNRIQSQLRVPSLFFAAKHFDIKMAILYIQQLTKFGANLHFKDIYENGFLYYCCDDKRIEVFSYLLMQGVNINDRNILDQSVLFYIARQNNISLLAYLCKQNIKMELNQPDYLGRTPIFYSAFYDHDDLCLMLIRMGALVNLKDKSKHTPIYYVPKNSCKNTQKVLKNARKAEQNQNRHLNLSDQQIYEQFQVFNIYHLSEDNELKMITVDEIMAILDKDESLKQYLLNPNIISQAQTNFLDWRQEVLEIVRICMNEQECQPFNEPVNEQKYGICGYYDIIKKPMDFSTISKRLTHNFYKNIQDFILDTQLIFDNCLLFNGNENYVTKLSLTIKTKFNELIKGHTYDSQTIK